MQNFPGIVFIWAQTYREIFKSVLVISVPLIVFPLTILTKLDHFLVK